MAIIGVVEPPRLPWLRLTCLLGLVVLLLIAHAGFGSSSWLSPVQVLREIVRGHVVGDPASDVVWAIRLPRACGCALAGAILGAVGAAFQSLFRNPLAEPYVIGVSGGAAVGGSVALVTGFAAACYGLGGIIASFVGGMGALALVVGLAQKRGALQVSTLLLAGVVIGALLSAILTMVLLLGGQDTNIVLRWLLGSTTPMFWNRVAILFAALVVGFLLLLGQSRRLNAFSVSEFMAERLGVNTNRLKWSVLVTGTAMTSAAVGSVGIIGFLGLVAPHISRRVLAIDLRVSLIGATLIGSGLLLGADIVAQRAKPGLELPVGAVTAVLGAPALLVLLKKKG